MYFWQTEELVCHDMICFLVQLCRHRFEFRPVYAPDAPSRLPWIELIWGLAVKSMSGLAVGARVRLLLVLPNPLFAIFAAWWLYPSTIISQVLIVIFTWLFCVPLVTCWMWRLAFLTSLSQVSYADPRIRLSHCLS